MLAVTTLLAAGLAFIITPVQLRFFLGLIRHRDSIIAQPATVDFVNVGFLRALDRGLPPDTRIFFSGVVGTNDHLASYYFARSFLYPREVEISLDHKADFQVEGFRGVDCSSPDQLRTNGYDLMLKADKNQPFMALPLTPKGELRQ
jgi:hypothetical protein